ncbi:pyridoxal-dependent decarboxylase [Hyphomonas sp. FCG-A18]|uniref:pyridoxal phosphate-dependent decarboxylase family protein n=1 Tax=Hyphomonas sp. FCG-A18 TaxID=3080019 RepID=UPI002B289E2D|nr:pyridoxal-dependent decarboxylase [Hyphomonas sp. FCG-A18]
MTQDDHQAENSLEPSDWSAFRKQAHAVLDATLTHLEEAREGRVWTPAPDDLAETLKAPLPSDGIGTEAVRTALTDLLPYGVGNTHPRFFGWVHGSGTPSNMLAEMVAAAMNANCGGRNHVGLQVEAQLIDWCKHIFEFPETASGLIVSGTSMATIIALKAARDRALDNARDQGVTGAKLVAYVSSEGHSCLARALDILGLGMNALRRLPVTEAFEIDTDSLERAIQKDRADGFTPFALVGSAGTVNTGAIDPLAQLAMIAKREQLWFHVDGAFGACMALSERLKPRLSGLEQADSLAFDFHKWLHVNYDAGCVLIKDKTAHKAAFSMRPDYLAASTRGLAAGETWPTDLGPELSRSFRALKVWAQLLEFGPKRLGEQIEQNVEQAAYLTDLIERHPRLERLAPAPLQINCFRPVWPALTEVERDQRVNTLVEDLQISGIAAPSTTRIHGKTAIRVNITNHRTTRADLDMLVEAIDRLAQV